MDGLIQPRTPSEDRDRDYSDVSVNRHMPRMADDHQKLAERQATDSYGGLQQKPILPNTWIWDFQPRCVRITLFCLKLPSLSLFLMAAKTNSQVSYGCLKFCDSFSPVSCKGKYMHYRQKQFTDVRPSHSFPLTCASNHLQWTWTHGRSYNQTSVIH